MGEGTYCNWKVETRQKDVKCDFLNCLNLLLTLVIFIDENSFKLIFVLNELPVKIHCIKLGAKP